AGFQHRSGGEAAGASHASAGFEATGTRDRIGQTVVRVVGDRRGAELLRSRTGRVLAPSALDVDRDRQPGGRLVEYRSESAPASREVRWPGCPQIAGDVGPVPCGGIEGVERPTGADSRRGRSPAVASRVANVEEGPHSGDEPDPRPLSEPG